IEENIWTSHYKKYLCRDNLKVIQSDDTQSSIDDAQDNKHSLLNETQDEAEREYEVQIQFQKNIKPRPAGNWNTSKKPRLQEDVDKRILKALENPPDEDEAFLMSITPSVRQMSEDDTLEFRMNVLQLIKKISTCVTKCKRQHLPPTHLHQPLDHQRHLHTVRFKFSIIPVIANMLTIFNRVNSSFYLIT
ncbi:unnamed protein product, partial [Acanthoscelides obtectus]